MSKEYDEIFNRVSGVAAEPAKEITDCP